MPFNRPIPDRDQKPKDSGGIATLVQAEKLMQIAILLPSSAFIGWLGGAWLDLHLHQTWIGLVGILFGGIPGLVYVVRLVMAGTSRTGSGGGAGMKSGGGSDGGGS